MMGDADHESMGRVPRRVASSERPTAAHRSDLDRARADVWSELADAVAGLGEGRSPEAVLAAAVGRLRRATGAERAVVWLDVAGQVRPEIVDPPGIVVAAAGSAPGGV